MSLVFRQLFHHGTYTFTYLLGCGVTRRAVLIDPVLECADRDIKLLQELDLDIEYTLNTHIHGDHVRSCKLLKEKLGSNKEKDIVIKSIDGCKRSNGDICVSNNDIISFGNDLKIKCLDTPGHTLSDFSYYLEHGKDKYVFTGDALFVRGCGRTDFQEGSSENLYYSIVNQLFTLDDDTCVYPGHDYNGHSMTTIGEEKKHNPRIKAGTTLEQFQDIMENLNLRAPKNLEYNVSENLKSG